MNDLKFACRQMLKNPGFTVVTVLTLAVSIGATVAICSAVHATIIDPLPVKNADRLTEIRSVNTRKGYFRSGVSGRTIGELRRHQDVFAEVAVVDAALTKYRGGEFSEVLRGMGVSANFFELWHVEPYLGRVFGLDDVTREGDKLIVLSHSLWRNRFGGDPHVIGKTIDFEGAWFSSPQGRYTIVGVMPRHFVFPQKDVHYWIPKADPPADSYGRNYGVFARLAIGANRLEAQAILDVINARDIEVEPKLSEGWSMRMTPVSAMFADDATRRKLWTLFVVVGLVWLIACANIANLLLARAEARQHEMAMRAALGAGRGRLIRQLLTESLLLAIAGGLCGLLLTNWGLHALSVFLEGIRLKPLAISSAVFWSAMALSTATGIVFGLAPAWQASRPRLSETLKQTGSASTQAAGGRTLLRGLIVAEVAFAVVILASAGLMIRSIVKVLRLDVGYDPHNLLMAVAVPSSEASEKQAYTAFINRVGDNYARLPGVQSVGIRTAGGHLKYIAEGDDRPVDVRHEGSGLEERNLFATLRTPLLEGRFLDRSDLNRSTVIVNRSLARTLWPAESALGKRLRAEPGQIRSGPRILHEGVLEVVGVVGDVRLDDPERIPQPTIYRPCEDFYENLKYDRFYLRTTLDPVSLFRPIHAAINEADPGVLDRMIQIVPEELYRSTQGRRFFTLYLTLYAGVGLALATIGLYGLMVQSVYRRAREFGIRMALGSTREAVLRLVMGDGLRLALLGLGVGLIGTLLTTRLLQNQLYGVTPRDPATLALISIVLFLAAMIACCLPAYRATRIDPMEALRYE